jgi:uncharacterized protein YndB with AHSA1/START domain
MATDITTDTIRISAIIPATPERVYGAWLDSVEHSAITHSTAGIEPWVGGRHSAWGGSIRGTTLELQPNRRILQTWWASDFPPGSEESRLEVLFEPVPDGTLVTINHTGLPQGRGHRYEDGWKDFYLDNMKTYFPAHAEPPAREESMATAGQMRMDLPTGSVATKAPAATAQGTAAAPKVASKPAARSPQKVIAKKATAKKAVARKSVAKKATAKKATAKKATAKKPAAKQKSARTPAARSPKKKPASRTGSMPARARTAAKKPSRKPARPAAARAKKTGRVKARRSR